MTFSQIAVLAAVQGAAELLPVSSSAHVIMAEKLMGLDPTAPEMTLLLVMLHTGTMFAVVFFFRRSWQKSFFSSGRQFRNSMKLIFAATATTGIVGLALKNVIEKAFMRGTPHAEIELLFGNMYLIAASLAAAGLVIIYAGLTGRAHSGGESCPGLKCAGLIGAIQGICLPFRGFSRSGATISAGLLLGLSRRSAEEFSFALAVVLTPSVIAREVLRLVHGKHLTTCAGAGVAGLFLPSLIGMALSFGAGLLALRWLSSWLEKGRWHLFGIYCLCAGAVAFLLQRGGV